MLQAWPRLPRSALSAAVQRWRPFPSSHAISSSSSSSGGGSSRHRAAGCSDGRDAPVLQPDAVLPALCSKYGISCFVNAAASPWGVGLFQQQQQQQQQTTDLAAADTTASQQQLLVSVPLPLVLSVSIDGCSPHPASMPPQLQHLLHNSCCSSHWELQVAVLLLSVLQPWPAPAAADSTVSQFWREYSQFIPPLQQQASLLLWSGSELEQLQDQQLQATALAWQQTVHEAYHAAVLPCFNSKAASAAEQQQQQNHQQQQRAAGSGPDSSCTTVSLQDWLWAVAAIESRAFGVASRLASAGPAEARNDPDAGLSASSGSSSSGSSGAGAPVGLVPVLDLANHACRSPCHHEVDPASGSFRLWLSGNAVPPSRSGSLAGGAARQGAGGGEVLITYGGKTNRALMDQYGFCVPGNPFDRIAFPLPEELGVDAGARMSHSAIKQATNAALRALRQQQREVPGTGTGRISSNDDSTGEGTPAVPAAAQPDEDDAAAEARVSAAVASIISAFGWRNLLEFKRVTPGGSIALARLLLAWLQQQLAQFPTTAAQDTALLQQLGQGPAAAAAPPWSPGAGGVCSDDAAVGSGGGIESGSSSSSSSSNGNVARPSVTRLSAAVSYRLEQKLLLHAAEAVLQVVVGAGPGKS